ncbi:TrmB family transcriptional regulator [bacterium]|nr:TrmB family transcriptional regulator [bacterium]
MEILKELQKLGFTEYEAKIYLALLKNYPSTGYQISKNSGVPRSMVYEGLNRLHTKGAVLETIEGRATYYRPLPPEILLDQHMANLQTLVHDLKPNLSELYQNQDDTSIWTLSDENAVYAYATQMLQKASQEVFLVINDEALKVLYTPLETISKKNISLNVLITGNTHLPFGNLVQHPPLESQIQGLTETLVILVDGEEVLVANLAKEMQATITKNTNLILIAHQFIWMEFFTQRVFSQIGPDLLARLGPEDRAIFESITHHVSDNRG